MFSFASLLLLLYGNVNGFGNVNGLGNGLGNGNGNGIGKYSLDNHTMIEFINTYFIIFPIIFIFV